MTNVLFDTGSYDSAYRNYPKCEFWRVHKGLDKPDVILRVDDPKTNELKEDLFTHKMALDHHYLNDSGYPFCEKCGWCPIL